MITTSSRNSPPSYGVSTGPRIADKGEGVRDVGSRHTGRHEQHTRSLASMASPSSPRGHAHIPACINRQNVSALVRHEGGRKGTHAEKLMDRQLREGRPPPCGSWPCNQHHSECVRAHPREAPPPAAPAPCAGEQHGPSPRESLFCLNLSASLAPCSSAPKPTHAPKSVFNACGLRSDVPRCLP